MDESDVKRVDCVQENGKVLFYFGGQEKGSEHLRICGENGQRGGPVATQIIENHVTT